MPALNRETHAYTRELWERAMASERGIAIPFESLAQATHIRHACYQVRVYERKQSKEIYPANDPKHGVSEWDIFKITIEPTETAYVMKFLPQTVSPVKFEIIEL